MFVSYNKHYFLQTLCSPEKKVRNRKNNTFLKIIGLLILQFQYENVIVKE